MAHGAALRQYSDDPDMASHVMHDYTMAQLDPQTRGILDYAIKLTRDPSAMRESHVEDLRILGLNDEQILSVVLITCTFNFMTRLADGLGVEFPANRQRDIETWLTSPARDQGWLMREKP